MKLDLRDRGFKNRKKVLDEERDLDTKHMEERTFNCRLSHDYLLISH